MDTRIGSLRSPLENGAAGKERILLRHNETMSKFEAYCEVYERYGAERCSKLE
jgi:hypothetical protein